MMSSGRAHVTDGNCVLLQTRGGDSGQDGSGDQAGRESCTAAAATGHTARSLQGQLVHPQQII